jgi:DNA-binding MarR family transcriptional regulator
MGGGQSGDGPARLVQGTTATARPDAADKSAGEPSAGEPQWLNVQEQAAWRSLLFMHDHLLARLYQRLRLATELSGADYSVLVGLSEAPEASLRAGELGTLLQWEKSRLSKQVARMEDRGLVQRRACPSDGRGWIFTLTAAGRAAIERAAPLHVRDVRELFVEVLTPEQLEQLVAIADAVLDNLKGEAPSEA